MADTTDFETSFVSICSSQTHELSELWYLDSDEEETFGTDENDVQRKQDESQFDEDIRSLEVSTTHLRISEQNNAFIGVASKPLQLDSIIPTTTVGKRFKGRGRPLLMSCNVSNLNTLDLDQHKKTTSAENSCSLSPSKMIFKVENDYYKPTMTFEVHNDNDHDPPEPVQANKVISNSSITAFEQDLEKELPLMESHFKWIVILEEGIGKSQVLLLHAKMQSWLDESKDTHLSFCQKVTQRLQMAVYASWLCDFKASIDYIHKAELTIKEAVAANDHDIEKEPVEHVQVYRYLTLANKLMIMMLKRRTLKNQDQQELEDIKLAFTELKDLSIAIVDNNNCYAAILALKGQLANQLGKSDTFVACFREAVKLNPVCYDWQHHLYTSLRRKRREANYLASPIEEEIVACETAFRLRPDFWLSCLALAQLYEDVTKSEKLDPVKLKQYTDVIIQQLENAAYGNPNSISTNIRLAEAYSREGSVEFFEKSKELFLRCETKWPQNSQVLHKIGKFYNLMNNKTTAEMYFLKSLGVDKHNFPCLMDCLRLKNESDSAIELLEFIEPFIKAFEYKKIYYWKLQVIKGSLCWATNNFELAIESWITMFDEKSKIEFDSSELHLDLTRALQGNNRGTPIPRLIVRVDLKALKQQIEVMKGHLNFDQNSAKLSMFNNLEEFVNSLKPIRTAASNARTRFHTENNASTNNWRKDNYNQTAHKTCSAESYNFDNQSSTDDLFGHYKKQVDQKRSTYYKERPFSESESDNNWRSSKVASYNADVTSESNRKGNVRLNTENRYSRIQYDSNGRWKKNEETNFLVRSERTSNEKEKIVETIPKYSSYKGKGKGDAYFDKNSRDEDEPWKGTTYNEEKSRIRYDENGRWKKNSYLED